MDIPADPAVWRSRPNFPQPKSNPVTLQALAGPWALLADSLDSFRSNPVVYSQTKPRQQYRRSFSSHLAQLDLLKEHGQNPPLRFQSFGVDGASDLPNANHPNLSSFCFSFPTSAEPDAPQQSTPRQALSPSAAQNLVSLQATAKQPRLVAHQLSTAGFQATPDLPKPARNLRKDSKLSAPAVSPPAFDSSRSPDHYSIHDRVPVHLSSSQYSLDAPTQLRGELTTPRSLRRVIRADDSWQVDKNNLRTAFKARPNRDELLTPVPLQVPKVKKVVFKKSSEFLRAVQPLKTPERPTPQELLAREYSDEDLKPPPLSVRKNDSPLVKEADTPRLTRELVLRYLASDESLRNSSSEEYLSDHTDPLELALSPAELELRRIKKSRREGVIFEWSSSDSEEDRQLIKKLDAEIVPMADLLHPESAAAMTEHRREAVRLAKSQEATVIEKCKRSNQDMPNYKFDELIGKGSYGRVYKGRQITTSKVVAIKVIDIDEADFHSVFEEKDAQITDFNREIRILKTAQESGATNMNLMIEALPVHSQLWLICEYCPGGSVKTLMRATNDRLAEQYIIIVARELAKALEGLHRAGIMHRDIKAANVLIHEEGRLQLCDFGVATVLDTKSDKRKTFIGTPHWMPPELFVDNPEYSDEVDVWEYGCTLYECALGKPPHADLRERQQLASRMRRLKQSITLPEHENFSEGLRNLVAYTLSPDAKIRPSMSEVLDHEYLRNTEQKYPTQSLSELVKVYYAWLYSGGQRVSLFMPGGAVVSDAPGSIITPIDEWNFSTTEVFEKRISAVLDIPDFSQVSSPGDHGGEATPRAPKDPEGASQSVKEMSTIQKANFEARVQRGEGLANIFDQSKPDYEYKTKTDFRPLKEERRVSDLPFRAMAEDRPSSIASNVIDLGDFDSDDYAIAAPMKEETIQLADAATIRAKRSDSKGPARDASGNRKDSTPGDDMTGPGHDSRTSAQDFAFPPKEWTASRDSTQYSNDMSNQLTPVKDDGRKTMDWTFASAFASSTDDDDDDEPNVVTSKQTRANKHATLEWSFSNAQAEIDTTTEEDDDDDDIAPHSSIRTTPKRPGGLLRTMTQPVTSNEVYTAAAADDFPRPSTAMSEAYSESSTTSSTDFDPFSLEGRREMPASLAQAIDNIGVGGYYHNQHQHNHSNTSSGGIGLEHTVPYSATTPGPAPYALGAPARIGEPGFPGPTAGVLPSSLATDNSKKKSKQDGGREGGGQGGGGRASSGSGGAGGGGRRPRIELPEAVPPSTEALTLDAPAEVVEAELGRLLGGLQASLAGAGQALQMLRPRRSPASGKPPRGRPRPSSSEWEDEE